ncbi:CheR family methyltransferase [Pseudonocardia sp.]|uniref:CheR family methyltransferase n=1 Tax=Pseudonocardia sp. TaxID=60912 RepID=UPI0026294140|nr:CheR family methyltransferase [Pseudonocardia sp.]
MLQHLRDTRGFDFTGYKRSSISRRVRRRMEQLGITDHGDYLDHLELHGEEFTALFNTILINVTAFFRDPDSWEYLRSEVLPAVVAAKGPTDPIRVWSAGCASGEEAYTLAIVLSELLGRDQFRDRVKIYATDVDEEDLARARQAVYDERQVRGLDPELLERYFEPVGTRFQFRSDLRRSVIFGRNDLVQDAPISRIDVLVCRNTLMYLTAETQARILARFHYALAPTGVLFLGKAEMLLSHAALFRPLDLRRRVFTRVAPATATDPPFAGGDGQVPGATPPATVDGTPEEVLLSAPVAYVVLNGDGTVRLVNRAAEGLLDVSAADCGRPFRDVDVSYRPVELRRHVDLALAERRVVRVDDVQLVRDEQILTLQIRVQPLSASTTLRLGGPPAVAISFEDVTEQARLREELSQLGSRLETAHEELQSTSEELETTNEELQSTVEELETTNEELQSTNEELETINEELQSTNDELHAINDELEERSGQLNEVNSFLESVLAGLHSGVIVLGRDFLVRAWNQQAEELWGLRRDEVLHQNFLALDIGLPIDRLRPMIREALAGDPRSHQLGIAAVNRRGRTIEVRVLGSALNDRDGSPAGVILMMDEEPPDAARPAD